MARKFYEKDTPNMTYRSDPSNRSREVSNYAKNSTPRGEKTRYSAAAIRGFLVVIAIALVAGFLLGKLTGSFHHSHPAVTTVTVRANTPEKTRTRSTKKPVKTSGFSSQESVPANVLATLAQIDAGTWPPHDDRRTHGGTPWYNRQGKLPRYDAEGKPISYREWDVNIHRNHHTRDAQRIITGSDSSAYYTLDHYTTFTKIR